LNWNRRQTTCAYTAQAVHRRSLKMLVLALKFSRGVDKPAAKTPWLVETARSVARRATRCC
jgi:hypothetical protein